MATYKKINQYFLQINSSKFANRFRFLQRRFSMFICLHVTFLNILFKYLLFLSCSTEPGILLLVKSVIIYIIKKSHATTLTLTSSSTQFKKSSYYKSLVIFLDRSLIFINRFKPNIKNKWLVVGAFTNL